jgi:hypothetical protein
MKTGDIVVCIDNKLLSGSDKYPLAINKQYKVLEVCGNLLHTETMNRTENIYMLLLVQCDDGTQQHFRSNRFITLREYNLNKLKI